MYFVKLNMLMERPIVVATTTNKNRAINLINYLEVVRRLYVVTKGKELAITPEIYSELFNCHYTFLQDAKFTMTYIEVESARAARGRH